MSDITYYINILIFVSVTVVAVYLLSVRRLKLDPSALVTVSLYFTVMLLRFLHSMLMLDMDAPECIGINLTCHSLISMTMYYFVFEMKRIKDQITAKTKQECNKFRLNTKRNRKIVLILTLIYTVSYTTIRVLVAMKDNHYTTVETAFYIPTFTLKLVLDVYVIGMFILLLAFFLSKKQAAMQKGAHAIGFSKFNFFILYSIYGLLFMRIAGSIYTFIVGIVSLTPLFQDDQWELSYQILDDLVFPIRDFVEILFFSYLFYFESKKKVDLEKVNRKWSEINASQNKTMSRSMFEKAPEKDEQEDGTLPQINALEGDLPVGEIHPEDDKLLQKRYSRSEVFDPERDCPKAKSQFRKFLRGYVA